MENDKTNLTENASVDFEQSIKKNKRQKQIIILLLSLLILLAALLASIIYVNYDYLVFKTIMTKGYLYEDNVQNIIDEELEQNGSDIDIYFDDAVINIFMNRLHEENGDRYSHLYLPSQYTAKITNEKEIGNSCQWFQFTENSAYLSITNFTDESAEFILANAEEISQYSYLILDLRSNPGGYISAATSIADMFLDKGEIISRETSEMSFLSRTNISENDPIFAFDKIIILQDGNTASSSEILIGALHDNLDNVVLLGETTYGKGIGQNTVPLKNGFYFIATMFSWETPNGHVIHGEGIEPDKEFTVDTLAEELGILSENQNTE